MPKTALPPAELDTIPQFAARTNTSVRNIYRAIEDDRITLVYVGNVARIDPVPNMARIRRERPPARRSAAGRARMQHRDLSPAAGAAHSFRAAARKARTRCPQGEAVIELRPYQEDCVRR